MLSAYFKKKVETEEFQNHLFSIIEETKDKKVIIYGAGTGFLYLNKKYNLCEKLNIVGVADIKFEKNINKKDFEGMNTIKPSDIQKQDYDLIIVTNEKYIKIINFIQDELKIIDKEIKILFKERIKDEKINIDYLEEFNFCRNLEKLKKKLKNKTIILYGAGVFLEIIKEYYNLEGLNIIGVADKRFENHDEGEEFLGYKVYSPEEIREANPDYVLVATKYFIDIIENLYEKTLKDTKIKIKPLMRKPLFTLLKEIWR